MSIIYKGFPLYIDFSLEENRFRCTKGTKRKEGGGGGDSHCSLSINKCQLNAFDYQYFYKIVFSLAYLLFMLLMVLV